MNAIHKSFAAAAAALVLGLSAPGCGGPLTDGDWPGLPILVVRGSIHAVDPPKWGGELDFALVWAPLTAPGDSFLAQDTDFEADRDFASFELRVLDPPPATALEPFPDPSDGAREAPRIGVALFAVLEEDARPELIDGSDLASAARGASPEHYLVYAVGADRLRDRVGDRILNPIALEEGYNLALGLCRPGRPSQLLIVPTERIGIVATSAAPVGACLDVFWGGWR